MEIDFDAISLQVGQVFTPTTPVSERDMFSGRKDQIYRVVDVIFQKGQHGIIFGDRGVGKTSLANVLSSIIPRPNPDDILLLARINCDSVDTFSSIWKKVFDELNLVSTGKTVGFKPESVQTPLGSSSFFSKSEVTTDDVRKALNSISNPYLPVIIIDEFDRLKDDVKRLFADLIKSLSDHSLYATIILIGVGDSIDDLIREHESVSRAMVQIDMPRMNVIEIQEIIQNGLNKLGMTIDPLTLGIMANLSKGLPHYAHLIGKHSAREALAKGTLTIDDSHFRSAIQKSISDAQHSIRSAYHNAVRSTKKVNMFSDVILACALADVNELGEFAAQDVRSPLSNITKKSYNIAAFARHLDEFASQVRDNILIKSGARKRYRYKFRDPLMQSFVIMQGINCGKISTP